MSNEEISTFSAKDWAQSHKSIRKIGYMDGAYNAQAASYQSSFDAGYKQGLEFGIKLGFHSALLSHQENDLIDPRKINCQLCLNRSNVSNKVCNLINFQEERNSVYLRSQQIKDVLL